MSLEKSTTKVFSGGYRVIDAKMVPGKQFLRFLTTTEDQKGGYRVIDPLQSEYRALYLEFSQLDCSEASIVKFANDYGLLGIAQSIVPRNSKVKVSGEPIAHWIECIKDLNFAVTLQQSINSNDTEKLSKFIKWQSTKDGYVCKVNCRYAKRVFLSKKENAHLAELVEINDLVRPAKLLLADMVNFYVMQFVSTQLTWEDELFSDMAFKMVSKSLIGSIWMQLAYSISEDVQYRRCIECGKWFVVAKGERGKKRKFCSDACKLKDFRRRKGK